jgi:hypothetical protein|tara:strand:- start:765 stop:1001 length:237 start_codon:yes stop_codon:yes gene_type:complete
MAGRKYSNQKTNSSRINANNRLSRTVEKNESLGMAEYSPLTMLGKGVNYIAGKLAPEREARIVRQSVKASDIKKARKK